MRLSMLLHEIGVVDPGIDRDIQGLAQNSQQVRPGYLFLACKGRTFDGRRYIDEAITNGAVAVLAEADSSTAVEYRQQIPIVSVVGLSQQLNKIAARFFNYPAKELRLIGITGTNGKTSCSHFTAQALQAFASPCAVIGTLGSGIPGALQETMMTTPDAVSLQRIFSEFRSQQVKNVAMEVSSHSLDQKRIQGFEFDTVVFTNLTQDHLDYHGNMTAYGAAKKRFFTDYPFRMAVINADDAFGRELIALLPEEKVIGYSVGINPPFFKGGSLVTSPPL